MRRYNGAGYDGARPSLFNVIAIVAACAAVAVSVYVAVGRKPVEGRRVGQNNPTVQPTAANEPAPNPSPAVTVTVPGTPAAEPDPVPTRPPACRSNCGGAPKRPASRQGAPLRLDVTIFPANPVAGEEVTFTVTARDGDQHISGIFAWFGDGSDHGKPRTACAGPKTNAGTSAKNSRTGTATFRHVYEKPGTYKAQLSAESGECGSASANFVTLPVEMVIEAAPSPAA